MKHDGLTRVPVQGLPLLLSATPSLSLASNPNTLPLLFPGADQSGSCHGCQPPQPRHDGTERSAPHGPRSARPPPAAHGPAPDGNASLRRLSASWERQPQPPASRRRSTAAGCSPGPGGQAGQAGRAGGCPSSTRGWLPCAEVQHRHTPHRRLT